MAEDDVSKIPVINDEENDEGEESDTYDEEFEGEENREGDGEYEEDEEGYEGEDDGGDKSKNLTALLLGDPDAGDADADEDEDDEEADDDVEYVEEEREDEAVHQANGNGTLRATAVEEPEELEAPVPALNGGAKKRSIDDLVDSSGVEEDEQQAKKVKA
ncbi:hypothetical protein Moror_1755 [Moniliophthora roreri MCA 2997]|uniref:Uncharacterized protein n=1 Tax=Moniliophthora roreri (strain MCA 2997) TaxID=1381753 RepID=V2YP60_MONRO|nr:hypothetical protein Moror_1755 [Moniliophthora roreri MCA 2997]